MKRHELLAVIALALAMIAAGVTWQFGPVGLIASGAVVLVASIFIHVDGREHG